MKQHLFGIVGAIVAVLGGSVLGGCAGLNDAGMAVLSTPTGAVAIVNGRLLRGDLFIAPNRRATLSLVSDATETGAPAVNCMGRMVYTSTTGGNIDMRCNQGEPVLLQMSALGDARGYAYGQMDGQPVSLAYGMSNAAARAYLTVPAGKQLVERSDVLVLEPK